MSNLILPSQWACKGVEKYYIGDSSSKSVYMYIYSLIYPDVLYTPAWYVDFPTDSMYKLN